VKFLTVLLLIFIPFVTTLTAGDWLQWRFDANRTATTPHQLPAKLHLQWQKQCLPQVQAWQDTVNRDRMPYDRLIEPVVCNHILYYASTVTDSLTALDTRTGKQLWKFYTSAPIRLAPAIFTNKILFGSDDGYLYCLQKDSGKQLWKFTGVKQQRPILGNSRLVSTWSCRGGVVIKDDIVYFAAGIWPMMGTYVCAVNINTGKAIWQNNTIGEGYRDHPHKGATAFGGLAPQGSLAINGNKLIVPGGRSVPAVLDLKTGKMLYYNLGGKGGKDKKQEGGSHLSTIGKYYLNHRGINTTLYSLNTGKAYQIWKGTHYPVLYNNTAVLSGKKVQAYNLKQHPPIPTWQWQGDATCSLIKAGNTFYAGGKNSITAFKVKNNNAKTLWKIQIKGYADRLIAADNHLFVITRSGMLYAFAPKKQPVINYPIQKTKLKISDTYQKQAQWLLQQATINKGYIIYYKLQNQELLKAIANNKNYQIIAMDNNPQRIHTLRTKLEATTIYPQQCSLHLGTATTIQPPPYLATLTICPELSATELQHQLPALYKSTRPYGGKIIIKIKNNLPQLIKTIKQSKITQLTTKQKNGWLIIARNGALPGSSPWTHQYGNIANTSKSNDKLVKLPLGVLWYGGNSHTDVLPRHAHGPPPQVIGGRLFIQGINMLSARDVYTGKVLWKHIFKDLNTKGIYYDKSYNPNPLDTTYNQKHIPGANARGTNFVATADRIYIIEKTQCHVIDTSTGKNITTLTLPNNPTAHWGYIGVSGDYLVAGAAFHNISKKYLFAKNTYNYTASNQIYIMNRYTGKLIWQRKAELSFRHNAIIVGDNTIFMIDALPAKIVQALKRRGRSIKKQPTLYAINLKTGTIIWQRNKEVFATWLGYSKQHKLLIEGGRASRDMVAGEPQKMLVRNAKTGTILWKRSFKYAGPAIINNEKIILNNNGKGEAGGVYLKTGKPIMHKNPFTGKAIPWKYYRTYGCNNVTSAQDFLLFRSGAAGFFDLKNDSGTGNFSGFKSGCTSNLIAADGVLSAPDYTRTCTCPYQNQTSLALIYTPNLNIWTTNLPLVKQKIENITRLGINFGAPGNFRSKNGTLWINYPAPKNTQPKFELKIYPKQITYTQKQNNDSNKQITTTTAIGIKTITITLQKHPKTNLPYTIRLFFTKTSSPSTFACKIQNKIVLKTFSPNNETTIKEFRNIQVQDKLKIELISKKGKTTLAGIEIIAQ